MANEYITEVDILDEAKDNFLTYAEEVLTDRAIPSAEDGLLSAQRKILWTMEDYLKMSNKSKTKKCQALVGSTLSTAYFHGDAACYGVLCKMSQEFLMRYPLIEGQGSLGTQEDNNMVASARYTEAKPSKYADLMMTDFKKNVVPLKETYNGEFMEPIVLPSLFPNALCNGRQAIGISMAHNSAPMNLTEVCDGIIAYIKNNDISLDELMTYIKGPDFPLGGTVINKDDIKSAFKTGKSLRSLKIRGDYEIDGQNIIFTSIPYRTYRNKIKEQVNKNIDVFSELLTDFEDESSVGKNKLIFKVKKDISPAKVLNKLFALTDLQTSLSYNMNFIVNGTPKLCSLIDLIKAYVIHQETVLLNRTQYDKDKTAKRKHILDGLLIAIEDIDHAIELIRESANKDEAARKLIDYFRISEEQAKAILDMKLSRLTKLDKNELLEEVKEKTLALAEFEKIIGDKSYRDEVLINMITDMKNKYGDERRTKLTQIKEEPEEKEIVNVIPEKCVVVLTEGGTIKRIPATSFKTQRRNGKGIKTQDDITSMILRTNTIDSLMIFTDKGKMYRLLVDDIPSGTNASKGTPIRNLITLEPNENPTVIYSIYRDTDAKYVLFVTKNGKVKKTALDEYIKMKKKSGIGAIKLGEDDQLVTVCLIKDEPLTLITSKGYSISFDSKEIGASSRLTMGMKGITLGKDDYVVAALPIRHPEDCLAIFSKAGLGKKISPKEFSLQKKGGRGIICYKPTAESGLVAAACLVSDEDNILVVGNKSSICISAKEIPQLSRTCLGNMILKGNIVNSATKV